jgi:renalase
MTASAPLLPAADAPRVAIVGAGLAGLMCARTLADAGVAIRVFERSRGLGGRCSTRREGAWSFDHGAQYFTARDPRLAAFVDDWRARGVIARWDGAVIVRERGGARSASTEPTPTDRWVAVPGMGALAHELARKIDVQRTAEVTAIVREAERWRVGLADGGSHGGFDVVLVAIPPAQAQALLAPHAPALARSAGDAVMRPTWATMLVLPSRPAVAWDAAFVNGDAVLAWICRDCSKPGRAPEGAETWVLHATHAWSAARLDADRGAIATAMTASFAAIVGGVDAPLHAAAHRWGYAAAEPGEIDDALFDPSLCLGAAGDWCSSPRVEGALVSGMDLAHRVRMSLVETR